MEHEPIDRSECLRLLATASVGRVVFTTRALPAVEPVRFVLEDDRIVFRTWNGTPIVTMPRGTVVAFQVDALENATGIAWSVTVVGTARTLDEPAASRYRATGGLAAWGVDGIRDEVVAIDVDMVTGHRMRAAA